MDGADDQKARVEVGWSDNFLHLWRPASPSLYCTAAPPDRNPPCLKHSMSAAGGSCSAPGIAACANSISSFGFKDYLTHPPEVPDRDVLSWLTGEMDTPNNYDTPVFRKLRAFHTHARPLHV